MKYDKIQDNKKSIIPQNQIKDHNRHLRENLSD